MDASALESDIEILSKRSKSLDHWLLFWTVLVVLGLLIEIGMIVKDFFYPFPPHSVPKFISDLIGPSLVAIGVAGEVWVHVRTLGVSTRLQNASRELAGLYHKAAAEANERIAQIEADRWRDKTAGGTP